MLWFKHLVRSTSDPHMVESEMKWGSDGPHVFWRTLEILAAEEAFEKPLVMDFAALARWYPSLRKPRLRAVLEWWSERKVVEASSKTVRARIEASFNGDGTVTLFCSKLVRISDTYTRNRRTNLSECDKNVTPRRRSRSRKKNNIGPTLFTKGSDPAAWTPQSQIPKNGTEQDYLANMFHWMQSASTEYIQGLHADYPSINVRDQMNALYKWAKANPAKRRTALNQWIRKCFLKEERNVGLRKEAREDRDSKKTETSVYHPRPVK